METSTITDSQLTPDYPIPDSEPIGYHFRFTFSDQDSQLTQLTDSQFIHSSKLLHNALISKLSENGYFHLGKCTSGFEIRNKAGENCKAHLHIAFKSTHLKQSMNRTIKRYLTEAWEQEYIGNSCYSFKEQHIRHEEEFWRYPLKQGLSLKLCRGFTDIQLKNWHEVAKESYAKVCQIHQSKLDKKDKDDTLFLKVLSKVKKNNDTTKRAIYTTFINHYLEEDKPINKQVIDGYVINAQLKLGYLTIDGLLNVWKV